MGPKLWSKKLTKTDAQRQKGNPTGDLRLVKAKKHNSHTIEQTTYFREVVFSGLNWQVVKDDPFEETAQADFRIDLLGKTYNRRLTIGHKPSGEAGQDNYTTGIRWGSLATVLQQVDITGHMVHLYGPNPGTTTPFFLVVT